MWSAWCKFPILFLKVKNRLGHNFSQFSNSYSNLYFQDFRDPHGHRKYWILNVALAGLLKFTQFMEEIENWDFFILA